MQQSLFTKKGGKRKGKKNKNELFVIYSIIVFVCLFACLFVCLFCFVLFCPLCCFVSIAVTARIRFLFCFYTLPSVVFYHFASL